MTPIRSLLMAMAAVIVLIGARPIAGDGQFPRGLMASAEPRVPGQTCTIETRPLSFGNYDALDGSDLNAITQVTYTCSNSLLSRAKPEKHSIRIEMAQGYGNSFAPRHMRGVGEDLEYNIYLDATHRQVWGTGEGPTQVYIDSNPPNRTPVIVPVFGRIFGGQDVHFGPFSADVPVRILF